MQSPAAEWRRISGLRWRALPGSERRRFHSLTNLGHMFAFCRLQLDSEDEAVLEKLSTQWQTQKDPRAMLDFKQRGNAQFKARDYIQAVALYSKGISHSSADSPEAAVLYANRSAALYYLQRYQECLADIGRAQEHGYPQELQHKILARRTACLHNLRVPEGAGVAQSRESCVDKGAESPRPTALPSIQAHSKSGDPPCSRSETSDPGEVGEPRGVSPSIDLQSDAFRGRHWAATKDLRLGEVVLQEEAFAAVLIPEGRRKVGLPNEDLYCHHCMGQTALPLPCLSCSFSCYCSKLCRQQAWDRYHWLDCCLGGLLLALGTFTQLALRTVLVAGVQEVERVERLDGGTDSGPSEEWNERESPNHTPGAGCSSGNEGLSGAGARKPWVGQSRYQTIHSLLTHTERQQPEHRFLCAFTAAAVCWEIRRRGLEPQVMGEGPELEVGSAKGRTLRTLGVAMLRHLLQLECNAQAITALRDSGIGHSHVAEREQVRIATALYSGVSLLNHSCQPNTSVTFHNTTVTIRASQLIPAGQEVLHCYGPHWSRMAMKERQRALRTQYFFRCRCAACVREEEEAGAGTSSVLSQSLCCRCGATLKDSAEAHCTCSNHSCGHMVSKQSLFQQVEGIRSQLCVASALIDGHVDEALRLLCECRREARTHLSDLHRLRGEIEDRLAQIYASQGNWTAAARHLKKSRDIVEVQYGSGSVELGDQLFKLAQILFNGCVVDEALSVIGQAEDLLSGHFGTEHGMVIELRDMRSCLQTLLGQRAVSR